MRKRRFSMVAVAVAATFFCSGLVAGPADAVTQVSVTVTGTPAAVGGEFAAWKGGVPPLSADILATLAPNTGTGRKVAVVESQVLEGPDAPFWYVTFDVPGKFAGLAAGEFLGPSAPPVGTAITVTIRCVVTYPPLAVTCKVTISW